MTYAPSASVFTSVRQHFADPRIKESALVKVPAGAFGVQPVELTPDEAHDALYGADSTSELSDAVWAAALGSALTDSGSHGTARLLVLWLALPPLTRTAHHISRRMRAEPGDVESEMALALFEELAALGSADPASVPLILGAARNRAWRYARSAIREIPSTRVERMTEEHAVRSVYDAPDSPASPGGLDVRVDRPDGPEGLRASLRFRVNAEHLRGPAVDAASDAEGRIPPGRCSRRRRTGRRVGTLPIRPTARRA
ncbi:hypothetical protein ACIQHY_15770 [Streptomyces sp. NPDC092359]|uniref:hypothetical protein n=1 Tax=Streptomyces sp. NPDC092359 TaxID=3366014 RepID=UPI00381976C4